MEEYDIILGSTSEIRKRTLARANIHITKTISSDFDERSISENDPEVLVKRLSDSKMKSVIEKLDYKKKFDKVIVISADSVAYKDGEIRNKPKDCDEKRRFLKSYSNSYVDCITGISLYNFFTDTWLNDVSTSRVYYKEIPEEMIDEISMNSEIIGHSCGGFAIDCPLLERYVDRIEGCKDNILGISGLKTRMLIGMSIETKKD
ncbi:maf domain containing protein [Cryptosporidium bovis]|uniref:maf domain containing protein n=1 Tax=Cryptosporidium bovis TaxID=310047 RepID=UPI00351A08D5|nr:maf domain containing protein [Cryptosporidium bovis]